MIGPTAAALLPEAGGDEEMDWMVEKRGFDPERIAASGNTFMIGNGRLGYRGTPEEFGKAQLTACTLAGLYDRAAGDAWREPVNAPNGLSTRLYCDGERLDLLVTACEEHVQRLNIRHAVMQRDTLFRTAGGNRVRVRSERFASLDRLQLLAMKYAFTPAQDCVITVETGIDGDIWDINGPHLGDWRWAEQDGVLVAAALTRELRRPVVVAESLHGPDGRRELVRSDASIFRSIRLSCQANVTYEFVKFVSVFTGLDETPDPVEAAVQSCRQAAREGYDALLQKHERHWEDRWAVADVRIDGDEEAQLALRYSLYQLLIIAPSDSEKVSIPARGLSGQVYKGAVFWDTEMFMLPFFLHTRPEVARNLVMYRIHTLDGARRKAAEYGFRGAFYAWESQDTGDDACTLFNITDVFTNRPMRTFFRDKQIHISADAAYGIWRYYTCTGDESVLLEGGAEVILECARFFHSCAYFKPDKRRYELLDVTGPDEYHERVNNNAFTNYMAKRTLDIALQTLDMLRVRHPGFCGRLTEKLGFEADIEPIRQMSERLYVPQPDAHTGLIEQFDRYMTLEDCDLGELKSRMLHKHEYLGGGNGLATTTQILKQADVVLMLHLFRRRFSREVKRANWDYYEPRTEHGSSLSPCVYALVASDIGYTAWAYKYFMRTATIDWTGESKQYVGSLYIGGTHPAANGGAWMAAILGFAGVDTDMEDGAVRVQPALPEHWRSLRFAIRVRRQLYRLCITGQEIHVLSDGDNRQEQAFCLAGQMLACPPGGELRCKYR